MDIAEEIKRLLRRRTSACVRLLRSRQNVRPHVMAVAASAERGVTLRRSVFYLPPDEASPSLVAKVASMVRTRLAPVAVLACYFARVRIEVPRDVAPVVLESRALIVNGVMVDGSAGSLYVLRDIGAADGPPVLVRDNDPGILRNMWPQLRRAANHRSIQWARN